MTSHVLALAYANAYSTKPADPYYMISVAIPGWNDNYKFLSGAAFTIPISVVGIFMVTQTFQLFILYTGRSFR